MDFKTAADAWLNEYKRTVAETTYRKATEDLRVHLLPYWADREVETITRTDVLAYVDYKVEHGSPIRHPEGLARISIKKHLTILRKICDYAISEGVMRKNPVTNIPMRNVPARKRETKVFAADEVAKLISAARPKWLGDMILLAYRAGLRRGEMFGLQWEDVDLNKGVLNVRRSVAAMAPGQRIVKEPKTKTSARKVLLDKVTVDMLKDRKLGAKPGSVWVFESKHGKPISPWCVSKYMHDACVKAGVEPRGLHTLRHTHATMLLQAKVYIKIVQERLGHSNVSTTLSIYAHAMPSMQEEAVKVMEALDKS